VGYDGKNARKNFVGGSAGAITKFGPARKFQEAEDFGADGGVGAGAVAFANRSGDRKAADVVGAALIAEERAVAADARDVTLCVATDGGGACAGDKNDRGGLAGGFEREFEIGDEAALCVRECVRELALHFFVGLGAADSSEACAKSGDFAGIDASFTRGRLCRFGKRVGRGFEAGAERVGGSGARCGSHLALGIEEDAFGFGAAAIEAQDVVHGTRICDLRGACGAE
jgi:hypothetical protein